MTELGDLTPRQLAVASLVSRGLSDKDIGRELGISFNTVRVHIVALSYRLRIQEGQNARVLIARWLYSKTPDLKRDEAS